MICFRRNLSLKGQVSMAMKMMPEGGASVPDGDVT